MDTSARQRTFAYSTLLYLLTLPIISWFGFRDDEGSGFWNIAFLISAGLTNTGIYLLPAFIFASIAAATSRKKYISAIAAVLAGFAAFLATAILLGDIALLTFFGYHINGLVINLLITPGGFASMGLDFHTVLPVSLFLILLAAFHIFLVFYCRRSKFFGRISAKYFKCKALPFCLPGIWVTALVVSMLITGLADFFVYRNVLSSMEAYPSVVSIRMRSMMRRLGFKEPPREANVFAHGKHEKQLNYPRHPLTQSPAHKNYNIIWLVAESLRADLLSPKIMPETWELSEKSNRFEKHYSGGNGTRTAMFAMMYGLYGTNWDYFLRAHRGPVMMDVLRQNNYSFLCQTSARFTYPEFDRTIFSGMHAEELLEQKTGEPYDRDIALTDKMLDFIRNRDKSRPFFTFGFFESTHAPYTFPEDCILETEYMKSINYTKVSAKDAKLLYNRIVNAAHFLDTQFARLFKLFEEEPELADNTIIIISGDHGEEFFEKGRLGHNSTFVEEQIRTPLVIYAPGATPAVHTHPTHHTDIPPTLGKLLGVENPADDYSVGQDLFSETYSRDHFVVCGWEIAAFVTSTHKCILPIGQKGDYFDIDFFTVDDQPCDDDNFFGKFAKQLAKTQKDLHRFLSN